MKWSEFLDIANGNIIDKKVAPVVSNEWSVVADKLFKGKTGLHMANYY